MKFLIKNKSLFSVAKCFLASTKKSKLLLCSVALIISVLAFSVDDKEAIVLYMNKLQSLSDHKIRNNQKMSVQNFYLNNDPQKYERRKIRAAFNKQRNLLKQQWENYYRLKWPQEKSYAIGTKTSKPATQKIIKKVYKFRYFETH